jgi:hypothetical protein
VRAFYIIPVSQLSSGPSLTHAALSHCTVCPSFPHSAFRVPM